MTHLASIYFDASQWRFNGAGETRSDDFNAKAQPFSNPPLLAAIFATTIGMITLAVLALHFM